LLAVSELAVVAPKRILVTDDDPSIRRLVSAILKRAGYQVDMASGGRDALEKIALTPYDAVMLDLMMPEVSGFSVLARLPVRSEQPRFVIVMSAASPDVVGSAFAFPNVFATLRKPFEMDELIATVRACIEAPRRRSDDVGFVRIEIRNCGAGSHETASRDRRGLPVPDRRRKVNRAA
jgi:DNA-binding response OmpR family regulator